MGQLLWLLGSNAASPDHHFHHTDADLVFPLCSSEVMAMTLGFFAYRRTDLKLVCLKYPGLLGGAPPISHPMGAFWLLALGQLNRMVQEERLHLSYAPFTMHIQHSAEGFQTSEDLLRDAKCINLKKRKLALQAECAELRETLDLKTFELQTVEQRLQEQPEQRED